MKVIVIKRHVSSYPNPITFAKGDKLKLGEYDTEYPGWIKVITESGNSGWAPVQYIEESEKESEGIAKLQYSAYELTTKVNEELEVSLELSGWCLAKNKKNILGWVPCETVKKA